MEKQEKLKISQKVKDFPSSFTNKTWRSGINGLKFHLTTTHTELAMVPFHHFWTYFLRCVVQLPLQYRDADREGQSCRRPPCLLDWMEVNTSHRRGNEGLNQVVVQCRKKFTVGCWAVRTDRRGNGCKWAANEKGWIKDHIDISSLDN